MIPHVINTSYGPFGATVYIDVDGTGETHIIISYAPAPSAYEAELKKIEAILARYSDADPAKEEPEETRQQTFLFEFVNVRAISTPRKKINRHLFRGRCTYR